MKTRVTMRSSARSVRILRPSTAWRAEAPTAWRASDVRQDGLGRPGGCEDIDLELGVALVRGNVFEGAVGAVAGIVDQDVDAALFLDDAVEGAGGGVVGDVQGERAYALRLQVAKALQAAGGSVRDVALAGEASGDIGADSGGGSGDPGDGLVQGRFP